MKSQKKAGALLSYVNIALNMGISVFFTPFLLSSLGTAEFGLYKVIQSFAGPFVIMTFGMGTLVSRNVVYFDELKQKKEKENFLAMALVISFVLVGVLLVVAAGMYTCMDSIFAHSFAPEEASTAKVLFVLFILNVAVTILNDYFAGIIRGHEKFVVSSGIITVNRILRVVVLVVLLTIGCNSVAIIATDLALMVLTCIFNVIFGLGRLGEKIKFHYLDKAMLKTTMLFSSAILLQSIVNQVNNNMDSLILGVMTDTETVALYSVALTVFNAYAQLTTVVVSIFAPQATRMIANNASNDELTDLVSNTGRFQFMLAGAVVGGFALFGRNFIKIWVGEAFLPAYIITMILIVPITVPLIESVANSVLDAKLKRMGRSVILCIMALINLIISVVMVKYIGYMGAAYGTAISVIVGHIVIMNIYLKKHIGLKVGKMFKNIFKGLLPATLVSVALCLPMALLLPDTITMFVVKIAVFAVVYCVGIYLGMNAGEKMLVKKIFGKFIKKRV